MDVRILAAVFLGIWVLFGMPEIGATELLAYYPFDSNADDASGNNHNAAEVQATPAPGIIGGAYYFAGNDNSYIRVPQSSDFNINPGTGFTISFWVWVDPSVSVNQFAVMNLNQGWKIQADAGDPEDPAAARPFWFSVGTDAGFEGTFATPPLGEWHHMAWKFESNGSQYALTGFLDGGSASYMTFAGTLENGDGDLFFGKSFPNAEAFSGYLDEVKIFNTALSNQEVFDLSQSSPVPIPGNLLLLGSGLLVLAGGRRFYNWRA